VEPVTQLVTWTAVTTSVVYRMMTALLIICIAFSTDVEQTVLRVRVAAEDKRGELVWEGQKEKTSSPGSGHQATRTMRTMRTRTRTRTMRTRSRTMRTRTRGSQHRTKPLLASAHRGRRRARRGRAAQRTTSVVTGKGIVIQTKTARKVTFVGMAIARTWWPTCQG